MRQIPGLIFLLYLSLGLYGQNPHPYFRNYTTDDGLPSSEVHAALQDHNGYMWFGTDNGLSRFDGYTFKNYGIAEGLKDPVIFYMQLDPDGLPWLATMNGALYFIQKDSIYAFSKNDQIARQNSQTAFITDFYIDDKGNKYLTIYNLGILKISKKNKLEVLKTKRTDANRLAIRIDDRWVVGTSTTALDIIKLEYDKDLRNQIIWPTEIRTDSIYYLKKYILEENYSSGSASWIKSVDKDDFIEFRTHAFRLYKTGVLQWVKSMDYNLESKAVIKEADGSWLMGFQRGGGLRYYKNEEKIRAGEFDQFLQGISISAIGKDNKGGYWICTLEHGLFYCPDLQLKVYDQSSGFPSDHVVALDFKNSKELFVGFRNGKLIQFNLETNQVIPFADAEKDIVYDLLWDSIRTTLWMTDGRLNYWATDYWERMIPDKKLQLNNFIISKKMNRNQSQDKIWGSHYTGFASFNLEEKKFDFISLTKGIKQRSFSVLEDQGGRIWVAAVNGFFELKDSSLVRPDPFDPLMLNRVEDIAELKNGTLVLATKGVGVLIWDGHQVQQINEKDGLTTDIIENIHVDHNGDIWAGSHLGLNKISLKNNNVEINSYTIANGLPSNEITLVKSFNDQLWVGTNKGLLQWSEHTEETPSIAPIIEQILINNKSTGQNIITDLKHWQNYIQFDFLSINYELNGKIHYRFRMNNGIWNNTFNRSVTFAELAPGAYIFEVQAQNEYGIWSDTTQQTFIIKAPFWQTAWFTAIWMLGLGAIIWWLVRNRIEQIRQEARITQEMNELRSSALRAQMNPHFIFNCLNSIQNFIAKNDQANAAYYLARFAQLVRRALNASTEKIVALEEEINLLKDYLSLEQLRFKDKFEYTIKVDDQLDLFETEIPPMLSQPFVENAIIHGIQGMASKGKIFVRFIKKEDRLIIEIEDNGPGIPKTQQNQIPEKIHRSMGMQIPRDRLRLANVANQLEVRELKDEAGKICGTLVRLTLLS